MRRTPVKPNKKNIVTLVGIIVLTIGFLITFLAVKENTEQRRYAAYLATYPQPTPLPTIDFSYPTVTPGVSTTPRPYQTPVPGYPTPTPTSSPERYEVVLNITSGNYTFTPYQNAYTIRAYDTLGIQAVIYKVGVVADPGPWLKVPVPPNMRLDIVTRDGVMKVNRLSSLSLQAIAQNFGIGTVEAVLVNTDTGALVDKTYLNFNSTATWNVKNTSTPTCTLTVFKNDLTNVPPAYQLREAVSVIKPNDIVVLAANFRNSTEKQYEKVSNHLTLSRYFDFLDTNGTNCKYNSASNTLVCDHGLMVNNGGSSMAFRVQYKGQSAVPATFFATTFANNGDTGSCSVEANPMSRL